MSNLTGSTPRFERAQPLNQAGRRPAAGQVFVGGGAGGVFAPKEVNTLFRLRSEVEPCLGRTPQPGDFDAPRQAIHGTFKSAYAADFGGLPNGTHCGSDPG